MSPPTFTASLRDSRVHAALERDDPLPIGPSASFDLAWRILTDTFDDESRCTVSTSATTVVVAAALRGAPPTSPLYVGPRNALATLGPEWHEVLAFAESAAVPIFDLSTKESANDTSLIPVAALVEAIEGFARRRPLRSPPGRYSRRASRRAARLLPSTVTRLPRPTPSLQPARRTL